MGQGGEGVGRAGGLIAKVAEPRGGGVLVVAAYGLEQGFPGFRAETWNGIVVPTGMPDEAIARMARILTGACADPACAGRRHGERLHPAGRDPGEPACAARRIAAVSSP